MTYRITVAIAILSAIAKLFELLVYIRVMYEDLKGCVVDYQHGFVKGRSTFLRFEVN
jgi:hypothetical protein